MDAVFANEFSVLIALFQIVVVLFLLPFNIGFLYASARRGVVVGRGQTNHGTVWERNGTLHKSLAESAASNNGPTVVVLYGTGDNLSS